MNDWFEDLKTYLPKYLSESAQKNLYKELDQFPTNIDQRLYTIKLRTERKLFQGDGLAKLWVTNLPSKTIAESRVMVLSNSCDVSDDNKNLFGPRLLYCPIIRLSKYQDFLKSLPDLPSGFNFDDHLKSIRKQHNTCYFYLPKNDLLEEESMALLDRVNNCDAQALSMADFVARKIFTLSDYGFYLFLFKLSLHLTRIREGIARN